MTRYKRNVGDIFTVPSYNGRMFIKLEDKTILYAVYVAMNNQNVCGRWVEGCEVHHIDHDCTNDEPSNLMCVTPAEHRVLHSKPIVAYKNNVKVGEFLNQIEAECSLRISKAYISYYLKNGKPATQDVAEYSFEYADGEVYNRLYMPVVKEIQLRHKL